MLTITTITTITNTRAGMRARARLVERNLRRWARAMYNMRKENGATDFRNWQDLLAEHRARALRGGLD